MQLAARLRAVPRAVWLLTMLFVAVLLSQTAFLPNGQGPDEDMHVDLMVQLHDGTAWPWPAPGTLHWVWGERAGTMITPNWSRHTQQLATRDFAPRGQRKAFDDVRETGRKAGVNYIVQHPPLYYAAGAAVLHVIPDWKHRPFDQVWMLLRYWNVLILAVLPLCMWAIARRLALPEPIQIAAAVVPLALPQLSLVGSTVNNDGPLVAAGAVLLYFITRVLTGDLSRRTALLLGASLSVMMLLKGFALAMPLVVAVAYLAAGLRFRARGAAFWSLALAALAALPGAAWWFRNLSLYGSFQPAGSFEGGGLPPATFGWGDGGPRWLTQWVADTTTTFFFPSRPGYFDQYLEIALHHDLTWWLSRLGIVLFLVGLAVALWRRSLPRHQLVILVLPLVLMASLVAYGSWTTFESLHELRAAQGRYAFAGLPTFAVAALAGAAALRASIRRWVPLALLGFAFVMQAASLVREVAFFWVPAHGALTDRGQRAIDAVFAYYPFASWLLATLFVATGVLLAAAAFTLVREARRDRAEPAAELLAVR